MENTPDFSVIIKKIKESDDRKTVIPLLTTLIENRLSFYHFAIAEELLYDLSECLYKTLLLQLDKEEEDSIEAAELAYIGISHLISDRQEKQEFEYLKHRILLLHYFYDYYTDSIIEIFLKEYRSNNLLEARNMSINCLKNMQLHDINRIEILFPDLIEKDEQLCDVCNTLESINDFTEEDDTESGLMHKVLHAYLKVKYKPEKS